MCPVSQSYITNFISCPQECTLDKLVFVRIFVTSGSKTCQCENSFLSCIRISKKKKNLENNSLGKQTFDVWLNSITRCTFTNTHAFLHSLSCTGLELCKHCLNMGLRNKLCASSPPYTHSVHRQNANGCLPLHPGLDDTCTQTRTRPEVDSCTITLLSSRAPRSCPGEGGQNSHMHMEQPVTHSQCARKSVCECVALQHFAYVCERAHKGHGPKWGHTRGSTCVCSFSVCVAMRF